MRYTFHFNFKAESEQDAVYKGRALAAMLLLMPNVSPHTALIESHEVTTAEWDVSGRDEQGELDWSNIIDRMEIDETL